MACLWIALFTGYVFNSLMRRIFFSLQNRYTFAFNVHMRSVFTIYLHKSIDCLLFTHIQYATSFYCRRKYVDYLSPRKLLSLSRSENEKKSLNINTNKNEIGLYQGEKNFALILNANKKKTNIGTKNKHKNTEFIVTATTCRT